MPLHGLGVAAGQNEGRADAALGTDGAENIGGGRALILGRAGSGPAWRPAPRDLVFLTDPRFILPPEFYVGIGREAFADLFQFGGKFF